MFVRLRNLSLKKKSGFSLVEVVCSFIVVGVSLVAILGTFFLGTKGNTFKERQMVACDLLQRKVEEIKCKKFATPVAETNTNYTDFPDYHFDVTELVGYDSNPYLKKVTVIVGWENPFGVSQQESLIFLVSDR